MDSNYHFFAKLLEEEKEKIQKTLAVDKQERNISLKDSFQELSLVDNHPADTGSELFERSKDFSLHEKHVRTLKEIDEALQKIEEGTYGYCTVCGKGIELQRLEALPYAERCLECEKLQEEDRKQRDGSDNRPVEEMNLYPPFGRTFLDEKDYTGFEGEDAWQEVARYGTADSPQDEPEAARNPAYQDPGEEAGAVEKTDGIADRRKKLENNDTEGE